MLLSIKENGEIKTVDAGEDPFSDSYDVIVAGLGTSGAIALITAASKGLRVLGIDRMNCMGGMGTAGSVNGYYFGSSGGAYEELDQKWAPLIGTVYTKAGGYNVEAKKYVLEQEAIQYGAELAYESVVTGVYMEGKQVKGVRWIGPNGVKSASCKVLIDCTGDAEACHMAGGASSYGRELDGKAQPFTSVKVFASGSKVGWRNFDSGCTDQRDAYELSKAIINSHAQHLEDSYTDDHRLLYLAPLLGIREGRLIEGEETVSIERFFADDVTDEPVFFAYADIDKHGRDHAFESIHLQDWFVASNLGAVNVSVPIPLGAMIPKGYEGLMAAGRCLSVDHDLSTCVRMNRDMQKSGEAAATAAWLSIRHGVAIKDVPYDELISYLTATGCYNPDNNKGYQFAYPSNNKPALPIEWLTDAETIRQGLSSNQPGVAIWSCRRLGDTIRHSLQAWAVQEEDEMLRKHSSIALALLGDDVALPELRQMVNERDGFLLKDCRKNNQMRGFMAIYMLGRMQDELIAPELIRLVTDPAEIENPLYEAGDGPNASRAKKYNDIYYQFFSHAVIALLKIGERHMALRELIADGLMKAVSSDLYIENITLKPNGTYEYSIADNIRLVVQRELAKWSSAAIQQTDKLHSKENQKLGRKKDANESVTR